MKTRKKSAHSANPRYKAFWRALHSLAHPLSIAAVALLLLNDHWLRRNWPSWWTGKIGDVAWLAFAPLLLTALLAWLVPYRLARREEIVGKLAFGLTGVGFALAKTLPAAHSLTLWALELLTGGPVALRRDPADLLALPALWLGWRVWQQAQSRTIPSPSRGWVALSLAALATLANQPPTENYGIVCLVEQDSTLFALAPEFVDDDLWIVDDRFYSDGGYSFHSQDGGLSWEETAAYDWDGPACPQRQTVWMINDPDNENVLYRFTPGAKIERSSDGGTSWQREISFSWNEARVAYYERSRYQQGLRGHLGPLEALVHRPSGHIIVAMGQEGVLVRTANAEWRWVAVGRYQRQDTGLKQTRFLLPGELGLALVLIFLVVETLGQGKEDADCGTGALVIAWILWGLVVIVVPPAITYDTSGYTDVSVLIFSAGILLSALFAVPFALRCAWQLGRFSPRALKATSMFAIVTALIFFAPYLLWSQGVIPYYRLATFIALFLAGGTIFVAARRMEPYYDASNSVEKDEPQITQE